MLYYLNRIACLVKLYALHLHHQNKTTVQWQHRNTTRARS